jgi:O-antigen/teichoic acid export membrane protein
VWYGLWWKSFFLNLSGLFAGIRVNGAILVLATTMTATGVGLIYWGNNIASQAVFLVAGNLANVIQPLFLRIKDEQGKLDAFHRCTRLLCFVLAPLCMLQAILAKDIICLVFHERWHNAAQIVAIISVGLVCTPLAVVGQGLMTAGARYFSLVLANGVYAMFVIGSTCAVFFSNDLVVVSCASAVGNTLGSIAFGWMAVQPNRGSLNRVLNDVASPLIGTIIVVAVGTCLLTFLENWHPFSRICLVLIAAFFFTVFVLWFRPNQETKWVVNWISNRLLSRNVEYEQS